jgi:hypothetical protein
LALEEAAAAFSAVAAATDSAVVVALAKERKDEMSLREEAPFREERRGRQLSLSHSRPA